MTPARPSPRRHRGTMLAALCVLALLLPESASALPWFVSAEDAPGLERALDTLWEDHPFEIEVAPPTGDGVFYANGVLVMRRDGDERRMAIGETPALQVTVARSWLFQAPVTDSGWVPPLPSVPEPSPAPVEPIEMPIYAGVPIEASLGFGVRPGQTSFAVQAGAVILPFQLTSGTELGLSVRGTGLELAFGPEQTVDVSSFVVAPVVSHPVRLGSAAHLDVRGSLGVRGLWLSPPPEKMPGFRLGATLGTAVHLWSEVDAASGLRWGPHIRLETDLNKTLTQTERQGSAQYLHPVSIHIGAGVRLGGSP